MRKSSSSFLPIDTSSYVVRTTDSLSSIAAHFGTTTSVLKHLNRLMCDLVYPGQVLFVPNKEQFPSSSCPNSPNAIKQDVVVDLKPKRAGHAERLRTSSLTEVLTPPRPLSIDEVKRLNDQCDERFIKVHVNRIIHQKDVVVNGVMLVTPDCIMFDPDEACPLVVENGAAKYSMTVDKQSVISVSVYHEKDYSTPAQDYNAPLPTSVRDQVCGADVQHGKFEKQTSAELLLSQQDVGHLTESDNTCPKPVDGSQDTGVPDSCLKDGSLEQLVVDTNVETLRDSMEATHFDAVNQSVARTMPTSCISESTSVAHSDKPNTVNASNATNCSHCSSKHLLSSHSHGLTEFLPLHLCISVRHSQKYCYSVPYDKIDPLYAFFIQWSYSSDECKQQFPEEQEFVVVGDADVAAVADLESTDSPMHYSSSFSKDWEIVNIRELRRRISEAEVENLPLPDLSHPSEILEKSHLRLLMSHLPARAEGSSWRLLYSSSLHGFSLRTLYRLMTGVDSPVLLVIKDAASRVFGTMQSSPVKKSDLFYGTGESYLFTFATDFKKFGWTGYNNFFTKGDNESLCFGASRGNYGLWLDGDLYHGRTQHCSTYNNDVLTVAEDFTIKCLEAWSFN